MKNINNECPCDYENTDYCTFCRDRGLLQDIMYSIEDIKAAFDKARLHPIYKTRVLDILTENDD